MDKNGSTGDKEKIYMRLDLKNFFKMYIPAFFHPYLYNDDANADFFLTALEDDKKFLKKQDLIPKQQRFIVEFTLTHPKLQLPLVVTKVISMNKALAELFLERQEQEYPPTSNTSSRIENSSNSSRLPAYLSETKEKQHPSNSSTKASTSSTSQLVTTETTSSQSTQLESISEEATSSPSPVVRPKVSSTNPREKEKQRDRKKEKLKVPSPTTHQEEISETADNLMRLQDLTLEAIKKIYDEGQTAQHVLLQEIKNAHKKNLPEVKLTTTYRRVVTEQVKLAKLIKEKEEEEEEKEQQTSATTQSQLSPVISTSDQQKSITSKSKPPPTSSKIQLSTLTSQHTILEVPNTKEKQPIRHLHSSDQQQSSSSTSTKKKKKEKKTSHDKIHASSTSTPSEEVTTSINSEQTTVQMPLETKMLVATDDKQQPSSHSHHKQKKKQTQTPAPSSNQSLPSVSAGSPSPSIESTSQQSQPKTINPKETMQHECTQEIPKKKKEKKKHLKHTPKKSSSSILTHSEEEKPSTSNEDSTTPYPPQSRPVFEEVKIPDTPKKKPKKKKKSGFGTLVGDSLLSEGRTASTSETTPIQTPSGFTKQDYKAEKEALKNSPLSPPDEFSDDDNTKEDTGPKYIPGVFSGNNLDMEDPKQKKPPTYLPNIIGELTTITTETLETFDIYSSPLEEEEEDSAESQENVDENKEVQVPVNVNEQSQQQLLLQSQPQPTDNSEAGPSGQNTPPQNPVVAQASAQPTPPTGNRRTRRQQAGQTQLLTKKPPSTSSLVAELLPEGQFSSLQSLQFALSDSSELISGTLKSLALKAHSSCKHLSTTHKKSQLRSSNRKTSGSFNKITSPIENTNIIDALQPTKPYTVFTSMNKYTTNLENKLRSAQAGIMLNFSPTINIGLAYNCNKKEYKEYSGAQLNSSNGSVKSKSTTDGLAAIFTLNPEKKGLTGTMIGSYSWGKVTNSRRVTHGEKHIVTKGSPDITLTGGLVQIGYNIPTIKTLMLTPYVECLISNVRWSPYTEKQSPVTYKISENRKNLLEKSIGLKTKCELTEHSQLQTWIVGSSGLKKTNSLSSNSMITPLFKYTISAPSYKKKYTKAEGGLSYEVQLSPTLTLGVDGILSFEKIKKIEKKQHMFLHFNYYY